VGPWTVKGLESLNQRVHLMHHTELPIITLRVFSGKGQHVKLPMLVLIS